jgi:hypothetical protein
MVKDYFAGEVARTYAQIWNRSLILRSSIPRWSFSGAVQMVVQY